jgi:hypothetical protein
LFHTWFSDSQWELMYWLPKSLLLLYNPIFRQAKCFASCLLHAGSLLDLPTNHEDWSTMFLWINGWRLLVYMVLYPWSQNSSKHLEQSHNNIKIIQFLYFCAFQQQVDTESMHNKS